MSVSLERWFSAVALMGVAFPCTAVVGPHSLVGFPGQHEGGHIETAKRGNIWTPGKSTTPVDFADVWPDVPVAAVGVDIGSQLEPVGGSRIANGLRTSPIVRAGGTRDVNPTPSQQQRLQEEEQQQKRHPDSVVMRRGANIQVPQHDDQAHFEPADKVCDSKVDLSGQGERGQIETATRGVIWTPRKPTTPVDFADVSRDGLVTAFVVDSGGQFDPVGGAGLANGLRTSPMVRADRTREVNPTPLHQQLLQEDGQQEERQQHQQRLPQTLHVLAPLTANAPTTDANAFIPTQQTLVSAMLPAIAAPLVSFVRWRLCPPEDVAEVR